MKRILLIDDHDEIRRLLREFLEPSGYHVTDAASVDEALALQDGAQFDLLVTDICMPGKNGLRAIADFKATSPKIRVIAISGGPAAGTTQDGSRTVYHDLLDEAIEMGAESALIKPFDREQLLNAVSQALGKEQPTL